MRLVLHDLETDDYRTMFPDHNDDTRVISKGGRIRCCKGCFGCWTGTPGRCVMHDEYSHMGELLAKSDVVLIISKCCYGCYSPFIKNLLDRSIPYLHPYFVIKNGEMHHKKRYNHQFCLKVWFYGEEIDEADKRTAQKLVKANAENLYCSEVQIRFMETAGLSG